MTNGRILHNATGFPRTPRLRDRLGSSPIIRVGHNSIQFNYSVWVVSGDISRCGVIIRRVWENVVRWETSWTNRGHVRIESRSRVSWKRNETREKIVREMPRRLSGRHRQFVRLSAAPAARPRNGQTGRLWSGLFRREIAFHGAGPFVAQSPQPHRQIRRRNALFQYRPERSMHPRVRSVKTLGFSIDRRRRTAGVLPRQWSTPFGSNRRESVWICCTRFACVPRHSFKRTNVQAPLLAVPAMEWRGTEADRVGAHFNFPPGARQQRVLNELRSGR